MASQHSLVLITVIIFFICVAVISVISNCSISTVSSAVCTIIDDLTLISALMIQFNIYLTSKNESHEVSDYFPTKILLCQNVKTV